MARPDEVRAYWDRRIATWDDSSYVRDGRRGVMGRLRSSVNARMELALAVLRPHVPGKTILDLGCGGGRMAIEAVRTLGAARAHGIDISPAAIDKARALAEETGVADRVTFEANTVASAEIPEADITLGLGLLDWLDDAETETLFTALKGRRVLLSYSEQDRSLAEIIHRIYLVYPLRLFGGQVRVRHHRREEIIALMDRHGLMPCEIVHHPAARFGKLLHNLAGLKVPVPKDS